MTTLGTTLAATCSTVPIGGFAARKLGVPPPRDVPSLAIGSCPWCSITDAAAPPMPADTTAIAHAPTANPPARERFRGGPRGGGGGPPGGAGLPAPNRAVRLLPVLRLLAVTPVMVLGVRLLLPMAGI